MAVAPVRFHSAFEQRVYSFLEKFAQAGQIELHGGADHFLAGSSTSSGPRSNPKTCRRPTPKG